MKDDKRSAEPCGDGASAFDHGAEAPLLSAHVDGELSAAQTRRIDAHLKDCPACREQVARLRRMQEVMDVMKLREPSAEEWESFWRNDYNRAERSLAWLAVTLAAVILGGYGLYNFVESLIQDAAMPWYVRFGIFAGCFGILLLLVSVIRERIYTRKRSRYDDVVR